MENIYERIKNVNMQLASSPTRQLANSANNSLKESNKTKQIGRAHV